METEEIQREVRIVKVDRRLLLCEAAYAGLGIALVGMLLGPPLWAKIALAVAAVGLLIAAIAIKRRLLQTGLVLRIAMDVPLTAPPVEIDESDDGEPLSSGMATITDESSSGVVDVDDRPAVPHWSDVAFPDPDVELGHKPAPVPESE